MSDNPSNLIVILKDKIAFSPYFYKPNGFIGKAALSTFIGLMVSDGDPHFIIPIRQEGYVGTGFFKANLKLYERNNINYGPLLIDITRLDVREHYCSPNVTDSTQVGMLPIAVTPNEGFYTRSANRDLEQAATAACFIYDTIEEVYKASYKAVWNSHPPFFVGKVADIQESLKAVLALKGKKMDDDDRTFISSKVLKLSDDGIIKLLGLKEHP